MPIRFGETDQLLYLTMFLLLCVVYISPLQINLIKYHFKICLELKA
jgi:hypothetical protein